MKKLILLLLLFGNFTTYLFAQSNIPTSATGPAAATPKSSTSFYYPEYSPLYQRVFVPVMPTQDTSKITINALVDSVLITTQYFDPLGRPYETIVKGASSSKKDFVSFNVYDEFSRSNIRYLPFTEQSNNTNDGLFKSQPVKDDSVFYKSQFANESIYYGVQTFDASPLQKVVKMCAPGNSWAGTNIGTGYSYRANSINDSVRLWTIGISSEDDIPITSSTYSTGSLRVSEVTDERGIKGVIYFDELGRKILSKTQVLSSPSTGHYGWQCTYYVYDEMGNLRSVITPKAVDSLNSSSVSWDLPANSSININLCYSYWYDARGRIIMKRIPGKGKLYSAYDLFDRLTLTQDANLRITNQWSFISYDGQSRPDTTGLITLSIVKDSVIARSARSKNYPAITGTYSVTGVIYYDDYSWVTTSGSPLDGNLVTTNINSTNFITNYNSSPLYAQPIVQSFRTRGMVTGGKKLVLNSSTYLWTATIFDDYGMAVQGKQTNYSSGIDILTVQHNFRGQVLVNHFSHQKSGTNAQTHTLLTKYTYDHIGRAKTISKSIDGLALKTISTYNYNELGQQLSKTFGASIETQFYSYNIRGWLLGINSNYVNTTGSTSNYFGETIAYDYGFTNTQTNGNIAGTKWKSAGDGTARAYGYSYDNANRLTLADFSQQNSGSTSWTKDLVDYTVSGINYDGGGNILGLKQKGLVDASPTTVDSLTYQYFANSNQLQKVVDGATTTAPLGDFKDTTYAGDDYVYDANGNTLKDYNRHMHSSTNGNGAIYNFLDKADSIIVANKAGIHYYYDAAGTQLRKQINDYSTGTLISKNYLYLNGFIYLNDTLQYVGDEEGQIRYAKKINNTTGALYYVFEYEYYLQDHLGNVRTILTEGKDTATYAATMESADSVVVAATFSNVYTPVSTIYYGKPSGFDTNPNNHNVAKLNASSGIDKKVGPSIVLKVMAGDQVQISTYSFYNTSTQPPIGGTNLLTDILGVLGNGVVRSSGGKFGVSEVTNINNALNSDVTNFLSNGRSYDNAKPKAYLNWILFDNQFNYVSSNSGVVQVSSINTKQTLAAPLQNISKSGYLYVYVSNESQQDVYFDDITVKHFTGALKQEQSYYPHNLPMAGLSDKAILKPMVSYKGNNATELEEDYGLQLYNTEFRKYDPQIGRFNAIDALSEQSSQLSPYQFGANNPVNFNDPTGLACLYNGDVWQGPDGQYGGVTVSYTRSSPAPTPDYTEIFGMSGSSWIYQQTGFLGGGAGGGGGGGGSSGVRGGFNSGGSNGDGNPEYGLQSGDEPAPPLGLPPIFWEEESTPQVQWADWLYSQLALVIRPTEVVRNVPEYPGWRFLKFHYLGKNNIKSGANNPNAMDANKGNLADQIKKKGLIDRHEVPYASTLEGGGGAITYPVESSQNQGHGRLLAAFFAANGFTGGEEFWVPVGNEFQLHQLPVLNPKNVPDLNNVFKRKDNNEPFSPILIPAVVGTAETVEGGSVLVEILLGLLFL